MNQNCPAIDQASLVLGEMESKYLAFSLTGENYGISSQNQENHRHDADRRRTPSPGIRQRVVNLRGKVIPVIDLRLRFNLAGR